MILNLTIGKDTLWKPFNIGLKKIKITHFFIRYLLICYNLLYRGLTNNPEFQKDLFSLQKQDQFTLLRTLKKISILGWDDLYKNRGLKWELVISKTSKNKENIYSFRFSQKYRALALRQEEYLRVLTLHVDHDSAY